MTGQEKLDAIDYEVSMMDLCKTPLSLAIRVAAVLHDGQVDDSGQPYIKHPLRVGMVMNREEDMVAGILHDVIEDTPATAEWLIELGFTQEVVDAVVALSREVYEDGTKEVYTDFIDRCCKNDIARRVKRRDIEDNLIPSRLRKLPKEQQLKLKKKYRNAINQIEAYEIRMKN
jgi:(p)ppGpp synthase/HD superfamily hydrolase